MARSSSAGGAAGRPTSDPTLPAHERPDPRRGVVGPFSARQLLGALLIVLAVAAVLVVATAPLGPRAPGTGAGNPRATQFAIASGGQALLAGSAAPPLTVAGPDGTQVALRDLDGQAVDLAALRGHPVWINFWASWCPPCQAETPVLRDTYAAYRAQGLAMIGISVQESTVDDVRAYATKYGLAYTVAADLAGDVFHRYRVYGLPTQFLVDANGVIQAVIQGPVTAQTAADALARIGLAAPSGSATPSGSAAPSGAPGSAAPAGAPGAAPSSAPSTTPGG